MFFTQCDECFYSLSGSGTHPGSENQLRPCPLCILLQLAPYPLILVYQRCTPQTQPCLLHSCVCGNRFSSVSLLLQNGVLIFEPEARFPSIPTCSWACSVHLCKLVSLLQLIYVLLELSELHAHSHSLIMHYCPSQS